MGLKKLVQLWMLLLQSESALYWFSLNYTDMRHSQTEIRVSMQKGCTDLITSVSKQI